MNRIAKGIGASVLICLSLLSASCPPVASFFVRIENGSENMSVVVVQLFDDNGDRVTRNLLNVRDVRPGQTRRITVPLSTAEGAVGIVFDVENVEDQSPVSAFSANEGGFVEGMTFVFSLLGTADDPTLNVNIE